MTNKTKTDTTFVKITNKDIYAEIINQQKNLEDFHVKTVESFNQIIRRLDKTNGKVKKAMWIASTAITIALMSIGFLFQHLMG